MADLESFSFGDSSALADELLELVLAGKKTATSWAASEGDKGVEVGKRWIVKDGQGRPRAVIETVELTRRPFEDVDAAFAYAEGEGDRSLEYWRRAHTKYFTRQGTFSAGMDVYCERFRLIEILAFSR
ncbi:MAG TPA: ASCH domain-containing protein [Roseiarcus sp.]|nr:ASCH domain-containing protein [Roseiarcus sp.]